MKLYIRLAALTVLIGICAVIAGIVGGVLNDQLQNAYRKWLYNLE